MEKGWLIFYYSGSWPGSSQWSKCAHRQSWRLDHVAVVWSRFPVALVSETAAPGPWSPDDEAPHWSRRPTRHVIKPARHCESHSEQWQQFSVCQWQVRPSLLWRCWWATDIKKSIRPVVTNSIQSVKQPIQQSPTRLLSYSLSSLCSFLVTVCCEPQKWRHFYFYDNFGKYRQVLNDCFTVAFRTIAIAKILTKYKKDWKWLNENDS